MQELTLEEQATNAATLNHILTVQRFMHLFVKELLDRALVHDQSKLRTPEVEMFAEWTPKLAASTYGSEEYEGFRKAMGPALAHHYAKNRHHPEHFKLVENHETAQLTLDIAAFKVCRECPEGVKERLVKRLENDLTAAESSVNGMNALDLLEMFADWKAATMRHNDGNILHSLEANQKRFGISPQLANILANTIQMFESV